MKTVLVYIFLGWTLAPLYQFVNKYVFNDWDFLKFLAVICAVDTLLGFFRAVKDRQVSSRGFAMIFKKIIIYSSVLIVSHVLVTFTVHNNSNVIFYWFDSVVFSAIMVRECISIFENLSAIDPDALPKSILKYLKDFDSYTGRRLKDKE